MSQAHLVKGEQLPSPVQHAGVCNPFDGKIKGVEEEASRGVADREGPPVEHLLRLLLLYKGLGAHKAVPEKHPSILERKRAHLLAQQTICDP